MQNSVFKNISSFIHFTMEYEIQDAKKRTDRYPLKIQH